MNIGTKKRIILRKKSMRKNEKWDDIKQMALSNIMEKGNIMNSGTRKCEILRENRNILGKNENRHEVI